jgi:hypothetical protein
LDTLKRDAYGLYLVHYVFVVWLQWAMVFGGTLLLSWGTIAAVRRIPSAAQIMGAERPRGAAA